MGWGDELMVTGHARELQQKDPRKVRIVYERPRWCDAWDNNPRIAANGEKGNFQEYLARVDHLRPYMQAKLDDRWVWRPYGPPVGELYFNEKEQRFARTFRGRIVIEPHLKPGASPNKHWGWKYWCELANGMTKRGLVPTQLGSSSQRRIPGAEFVHTSTVRLAAALLSTARAAVLPEGGLHHAAAAVGCPAVVIFGGYIAPAVTGYASQRNLFVETAEHLLGCGSRRTQCSHCAAAMAQITPAQVLAQLEALLETDPRRVAA